MYIQRLRRCLNTLRIHLLLRSFLLLYSPLPIPVPRSANNFNQSFPQYSEIKTYLPISLLCKNLVVKAAMMMHTDRQVTVMKPF